MTEYDGVERSKTEQLRALLDDRGVKWKALSDRQDGDYTITATRWHDSEGGLLTMCICEPDGSTWDFFWYPTPEQAIAATLGRGTCKLEQHGSLADQPSMVCWSCSECDFGWHHSIYDKQFNYCPNCGRKVVE